MRIDTAHGDGAITTAAEAPADLTVREALRANPVCGEPINAHGVTLVTVARIGSGFRGRMSRGVKGRAGSSGFAGKPVGAYVLSEGSVRWQPAVDVNRLVLALAALGAVALLTRRRVTRPRSRADRFLT